MQKQPSQYQVRAVHCDYNADDETVYEALKRCTDPLTRVWDNLTRAKTITIKFNQDYALDRIPFYEGMRETLVSDKVARAVVRLLRERTTADIVYTDISVWLRHDQDEAPETAQLASLMQTLDVPYVNANMPPFGVYPVPGGGQMFRHYAMQQRLMETDALVSVQRMKNHVFTGVTLTLKNLFGLVPMREPDGRSRQYYHHLVRMPYHLADLGRLLNPTLNIVDGLLGRAGGEWSATGKEEVRVTNTLMAGDHTIATDAVGAYLMGHDPAGDWLSGPYHRSRNPLVIAAEGGFGTVNLDEIDWTSDVDRRPEGYFFAVARDSAERVLSWRKTTCEQALYYRDHRAEIVRQYAGEYILLQENEVKWHDKSSYLRVSRRKLAGDHPDQAMWLKYVDPDETEGEHYEVYEKTLADIVRRGL
jgi:uncharacterized protein (DUF362 family)